MDDIRLKNFTVHTGLRDDQYKGLVTKNCIRPRLGLSHMLGASTVFRAPYSRTFETPFNENLLPRAPPERVDSRRMYLEQRGRHPVQPGFRN